MRNPGEAAGLQYARTHRDHYGWAIGVGHANGLTAPFSELPSCPGDKHEANTGGKASHHDRTHTLDDGMLHWPWRGGHPQGLLYPIHLLGQPRDLPTGLSEPQ